MIGVDSLDERVQRLARLACTDRHQSTSSLRRTRIRYHPRRLAIGPLTPSHGPSSHLLHLRPQEQSPGHFLRGAITEEVQMMSSSSTATDTDQIDPIHPGEVIIEDFIEGFRLTQNKLATTIGVPPAPHQRDRARQARHHRGHRCTTGQVLRHICRALDEPAEPL